MRRTALLNALCRRFFPALLPLAIVLPFAGACDTSVNLSRELTMSLSTEEPEVPIERDWRVEYAAEGEAMIRILIAFGDGASDTIDAFGAQTAEGERFHAYGETGVFDVVGTVLDASGEERADTLEVRVTQP